MNHRLIHTITLFLAVFSLKAQQKDTLVFQGQLAFWGQYRSEGALPLWTGGRYIPQLSYQYYMEDERMIDFEVSANVMQGMEWNPFDTFSPEGVVKPYRVWARFSSPRFEVRLGLQKINFGSATMFRPLMWFDKMDPRDPLQLTDGVWGLLTRYYLLNNANVWIWGLYGNDDPKAWEVGSTSHRFPEFGGRFQHPAASGEAALSFHFRMADTTGLPVASPCKADIPEIRAGLDGKWDIGPGVWLEGVWIHKTEDVGLATNQAFFNVGADYTLGLWNGINAGVEHLVLSYDAKPFALKTPVHLSGITASCPVSLFDQVSAMFFCDWKNGRLYSFVSWRRQLKRLQLYVMGFWNPADYAIPQMSAGGAKFGGKGLQVMLTFNH